MLGNYMDNHDQTNFQLSAVIPQIGMDGAGIHQYSCFLPVGIYLAAFNDHENADGSAYGSNYDGATLPFLEMSGELCGCPPALHYRHGRSVSRLLQSPILLMRSFTIKENINSIFGLKVSNTIT